MGFVNNTREQRAKASILMMLMKPMVLSFNVTLKGIFPKCLCCESRCKVLFVIYCLAKRRLYWPFKKMCFPVHTIEDAIKAISRADFCFQDTLSIRGIFSK